MVRKLSGSSAPGEQIEPNAISVSGEIGPLTAEARAQLERLAAMPDEDIDLSDIPPVTDFSGWRRALFFRPKPGEGPIQPTTLHLDAVTMARFRRHTAEGPMVDAAIEAVLRQHAAAE